MPSSSNCEIMMAEDLNLACGYRFSPYDYELLHYYLRNKLLGNPLPLNIIREIDVYNYDPLHLPIDEFKYGVAGEAYFFAHTQSKSASRSLPDGASEIGYWKANGGGVMIYHEDQMIGFKKTFVFYRGKAPTGIKTPWVMNEYTLNPCLFTEAQHDDTFRTKLESYAICRIRNEDRDGDFKFPSRQY